ncbi:SGNH/GDSL hydrolase family protein [Streptomyces sp. RS10V-4]|uniref:SGNH/GDSL hydrolase family protein n=1 Tax=Streptomyces rhizoryzae TaxID=2932493 RepID=UPI0020042E8E|nr:SGNH/GDSL hydrolase family protein [Streptomyces rhizoryzae]MCK7622542.1 SGNH/GDSL hydrolase family protein [Streptomyces rhizoryzae]
MHLSSLLRTRKRIPERQPTALGARPRPPAPTTAPAVGAVTAATAVLSLAVGCAPAGPAVPGAPAAPGGQGTGRPHWAQAWGAAVQPPAGRAEDAPGNWSEGGFRNESVRQVVRVTAGGSQIRIRLSNRYGTAPLKLGGAAVARSAGGGAVWPGTTRRVTFRGAGSAVVPPGGELTGDPLPLPASPRQELAITLRLTGRTGPATFHRVGLTPAYRAPGDHLADVLPTAYTRTSRATYYLTGVDVLSRDAPARSTVVAFGDSVTDGVGTTPGADGRYPDDLAERLTAARRGLGVVNRGIAGNMLLTDSPCSGERGVARFRREVLDRPDVRTVILELGSNDIGLNRSRTRCLPPSHRPLSARQLIDGYASLVRAAHRRGIKVIGTTVIPLHGYPGHTADAERLRARVNHWIRTGGAFDAVADFDRALADPAHPDRPRARYAAADGLHPNDTGSRALARAIPLDRL